MSHLFSNCRRGECEACPAELPSAGGTACGCAPNLHVCKCACHAPMPLPTAYVPGLALAMAAVQARRLRKRKEAPDA